MRFGVKKTGVFERVFRMLDNGQNNRLHHGMTALRDPVALEKINDCLYVVCSFN